MNVGNGLPVLRRNLEKILNYFQEIVQFIHSKLISAVAQWRIMSHEDERMTINWGHKMSPSDMGTIPWSWSRKEVQRRAVLLIPILSTRADKTPTRAGERRARGKVHHCLLGLLEI
jgi:hypothetical protein